MLLFVSVLLHQDVHSVDCVFGDNGTLNWLVGNKMDAVVVSVRALAPERTEGRRDF